MSTHSASFSRALRFAAGLAAALLLLEACASGGKTGSPPPVAVTSVTVAQQQVLAAETAFAQSMADRDFGAFVRFLSPDAVFFSDSGVQHGISRVAEDWQPLFKAKVAPFSWAPDAVEVLPSGDLAFSTGVVRVDGKIVGRFNSIWRREGPGTWRIVFDKGEPVCKQ